MWQKDTVAVAKFVVEAVRMVLLPVSAPVSA